MSNYEIMLYNAIVVVIPAIGIAICTGDVGKVCVCVCVCLSVCLCERNCMYVQMMYAIHAFRNCSLLSVEG